MPHWHTQNDPRDVWDARDIITINVPVVYMGRDVWIWIGEQSITRGEKWVSPLPNPYVQPHINNRYIVNFMDKRQERDKEISGPFRDGL